MTVRTAWVACVTAVLGLALGAPEGRAQAPATPPVFPIGQVHAGMTGYGLTVVHGTTIERFDVKILGILEGGPVHHLILFRASGPVIRQAGGTASGMSGSPIYLDGRIAGALSFGYHFAGPDADLSLATPIEEMLKVLTPPPASAAPAPRLFRARAPIPTAAGPLSGVLVMDSAPDAARFNAHPLSGIAAVAPAAVPVVASRMSPAAFALLRRALGPYNVVPVQGYGGSGTFPAPPLAPGSSVGVELVRGDVEVGGIGTVTYRRGDQILAFGHPLLNAGAMPMVMTTAWIDTVVRAVDFPFKEGSIGSVVGTVTQDREVGVLGAVGRFPRLFGLRVAVRDVASGRSRTLTAQVVRRPDLAEALVPIAALSMVQQALDSASGGSAKVRLSLRALGVSKEIVREDLAYDIADISTASVLDVPAATQLLFGNFIQTLDPADMSLDIEISPRPNTALLIRAFPQVRTVQAGDTLRVGVAVKPSGSSREFDRVVEFTVPRDFPSGPAFLLVGTQGSLNDPAPPSVKFPQLILQEGSPLAGFASLDELIDLFEHFGKNTDVLVQLVPEAVLTAVGSNANPSFEPPGTVIPTDWVVLGRFQIPMTVK